MLQLEMNTKIILVNWVIGREIKWNWHIYRLGDARLVKMIRDWKPNGKRS